MHFNEIFENASNKIKGKENRLTLTDVKLDTKCGSRERYKIGTDALQYLPEIPVR